MSVGVLVDYFDRNTYYNEDLSLSSEFRDYGYMKIPGLYVSKSEGEKLKKIIKEKIRRRAGPSEVRGKR